MSERDKIYKIGKQIDIKIKMMATLKNEARNNYQLPRNQPSSHQKKALKLQPFYRFIPK